MNIKRIAAFLVVPALIAGMLLVLGGGASAIHDLEQFELDRNALDDGAVTGDHWDTLYTGGGSADAFTGVLPDIGADGGTQFQAGGSKDDLDISDWLWKAGEPLDKDDITNAYAAAYIYEGSEVCPPDTPSGDPSCTQPGDLIICFGLDRFANNGSAQVGFWFFQNPVGLTDISRGGGFEFSGVHAVGDVLVQSNFSQGGVIDTVSVYEWVGAGAPKEPSIWYTRRPTASAGRAALWPAPP
jgi:hypothetical protein